MLDFKNWILEQMDMIKDPVLGQAAQKASLAMQNAIKKGQNPVKAAQQEIVKSKIPMNKIGKIMPTQDDGTEKNGTHL